VIWRSHGDSSPGELCFPSLRPWPESYVSSQSRVTWNVKSLRVLGLQARLTVKSHEIQHFYCVFFAIKWRPTTYKMASNELKIGAQCCFSRFVTNTRLFRSMFLVKAVSILVKAWSKVKTWSKVGQRSKFGQSFNALYYVLFCLFVSTYAFCRVCVFIVAAGRWHNMKINGHR